MKLLTDQPIKIFYAEDDIDDQEFYRDALNNFHLKTDLTVFENGVRLMDYLIDCLILPDVIILDINMPKMNGRECLTEIRRQHTFAHVPVIMFSSSVNEMEESFTRGANFYVSKSYFYQNVVKTLTKIFGPDWKAHLMKRDKNNFALW